jgi:hypothetical protein
MDRDGAVARIANKVGFRTDLMTLIITALQDAQDELERASSLPWFLIQENQPFTVGPPLGGPIATPQEFPLPAGFIREVDWQDGNLRYQLPPAPPGPTIFLEKMDLLKAENYFFGRQQIRWNVNIEIIEQQDTQFTPGSPYIYVLRQNTVRIYPGPDKTYQLSWDFYAHDQPLSGGNLTNQWLSFAPWYVIGKAGLLVATDLRDNEALQYFAGIEQRAQIEFLAIQVERERAGRNFAMGARL